MIVELRLQNYRGFEDHVIPFSGLTILVGRNNAGKSTAVEALRLVGTVVRRFRSGGRFVDLPRWLDDELDAFGGVQPATPELDFDEESFFHGYGRAPAKVTARFDAGTSVDVFVGPLGEVHGVARDDKGRAVGSSAQARALDLPDIRVQPQLGPVLRDETVLARTTVLGRAWSSPSIHFRNQVRLFYEDYEAFKALAEATWPDIQIKEFISKDASHGDPLRLIVRDDSFAADVGLMGHGLQMWLQTMWFLARLSPEACVVLDEPDVYMHSDMQHRLLAGIDGRYEQVVVATHSTEIISTADPQSVVVVDRSRDRSRPLMSLDAAQGVIEDLGGVHHVHVARLFGSERFLMVEGDDIPLLAALQQSVDPQAATKIATLPAYETGGWGGWHHALRSKLPTKNGEGKRITTYCIFDPDYRTVDEIRERYEEAATNGIRLHVWRMKEIENYVLVPAAIERFILKNAKSRVPSDGEVIAKIEALATAELDDAIDSLADELGRANKKLGYKGAKSRAKEITEARLAATEITFVVPGKALVSKLSGWSGRRFGVTFSPVSLARELRPNENCPRSQGCPSRYRDKDRNACPR